MSRKVYKEDRYRNYMKEMNKLGQQMTLGTIIAIVLGVIVLVLLAFGFSTGWNNLWNKATTYGAGHGNIATVVQACSISCASGDTYGFCKQSRDVVTDDGFSNKTATCKLLAGSVNFKKSGEIKPKPISIDVAPCPKLC